jgi:hypothetical protein
MLNRKMCNRKKLQTAMRSILAHEKSNQLAQDTFYETISHQQVDLLSIGVLCAIGEIIFIVYSYSSCRVFPS